MSTRLDPATVEACAREVDRLSLDASDITAQDEHMALVRAAARIRALSPRTDGVPATEAWAADAPLSEAIALRLAGSKIPKADAAPASSVNQPARSGSEDAVAAGNRPAFSPSPGGPGAGEAVCTVCGDPAVADIQGKPYCEMCGVEVAPAPSAIQGVRPARDLATEAVDKKHRKSCWGGVSMSDVITDVTAMLEADRRQR